MSDEMNPELYLFFGTVQRTEFYAPLLEAGLTVGLLRNTDSPLNSEIPQGVTVPAELSFSDGPEAVCDRVRDLGRTHRLALINIDEATVRLCAEVGRRLGLPALSPEAAYNVRSKSRMRELFLARIGAHTTCRTGAVRDRAEALDTAARIGYPVVLKPGNLYGSYFVTLCADPARLCDAYEHLATQLPGFAREHDITDVAAEILVEEFMPGTNHSVDCLAHDGTISTTPVVDVVTGADMGGTDFHHFARITPSSLDEATQTRMRELACQALRALGITVGVAHVEFIHTPQGPRLIEVAGRPGANRPILLRRAFGIDLMRSWAQTLRGARPCALRTITHNASAVVTPYPSTSGTLIDLRGLDALERLESVDRVVVRKQTGDVVTPRQDGARSMLRIEMQAPDRPTLDQDLAEVRRICDRMFVVA
ncbi:ATP-grasp domain-containing protein [Streptomyces sp. SID3343]|uniref:ATP-grasp domain-containing protein n=1 Tax=Streptomyces sp. SID3343 TaxID=2690260 RepID=UPI00136B432A|nr:ATP-grasp domain-containing protein [Streptomyces sp. SID3343]MYW01136.1 ATP-grasp domain-containing protein [Streptomyces sp. SID3343]